LTEAAKNAGLPGNVANHSVRSTYISRLMEAEVPVNYVAQLSGHKHLESLDSYKTASDEHQRKMSLVLSSGRKKSPILSNAVLAKPTVKAWEPESYKQQEEEKQASLGEVQGLSGLFTGSNMRSIEGNARLIFHLTVHLAVAAIVSQSLENATLLFQITLIQIKLKFPNDS